MYERKIVGRGLLVDWLKKAGLNTSHLEVLDECCHLKIVVSGDMLERLIELHISSNGCNER